MEALHRTTDDRDLEQRKARRQPLLLGMVVAVAVASLLQVAVLRTGAPMDFMARYAAGGLVDRGRSPYDRAELLAAERKLWPGVGEAPFYDPPPTAAAFRLVSRLPLNEAALAWKLAAWSRRDQAILVLVAAISLPDTIGSDTFYMSVGYAMIPLSMSVVLLAGFALARPVPPAWAAATWALAAALLLLPIEPWFALVKGLAPTLAVLWLLPRLSTGRSRLSVADVRSRLA